MYTPKHTLISDINEIHNFMEANSFAILVTVNGKKINATHLPVLTDKKDSEYGTLYCHISKANEQWKNISGEVLVIFPGAHHYISPSWYETGQSVPTWNYVSVHAYGEIEITEDYEMKKKHMSELVKFYERKDSSYKTENLDKKYFDGLLNGTVAFKIRITKLEGKKKLSQNHPEDRQRLVIKELEKSGSDDAKVISELMRKNLQK